MKKKTATIALAMALLCPGLMASECSSADQGVKKRGGTPAVEYDKKKKAKKPRKPQGECKTVKRITGKREVVCKRT